MAVIRHFFNLMPARQLALTVVDPNRGIDRAIFFSFLMSVLGVGIGYYFKFNYDKNNYILKQLEEEAKKMEFFAQFNQKKYEKFINEEATKAQFKHFMEDEIKAKMRFTAENKKKAHFELLDKRLDNLKKEREKYIEELTMFNDDYNKYSHGKFWKGLDYSGARVDWIRKDVKQFSDLYHKVPTTNTLKKMEEVFPIPNYSNVMTIKKIDEYRKKNFIEFVSVIEANIYMSKHYGQDRPRVEASHRYNRF